MQAADAQKKGVTIEEYVRFIMAPFIEDKHMDDLWKELRMNRGQVPFISLDG